MMKNLVLLLILIVLVIPMAAQAQVSQIQPGQRGYTPPPIDRGDKKMSVPDALADIEIKMDIYEDEFALDAFEKAVLKNALVDFEEERMAIMSNENLSYPDKIKNVEPIKDQLMTEASVFLTKEEIARFGEMHFGSGNIDKQVRKTKKERKKKKKSKN